jgi:histidinol-phosphate phosphatase family protein
MSSKRRPVESHRIKKQFEVEGNIILKRRAVFLDRDGVIIEEKRYLSRAEDVVLVTGSGSAVRRLSSLGLEVVVLTNQSGIGRGFFTEEDYHKVMGQMYSLLTEQGARVDAEYFCPHAPGDGCNCRKPLTGLAARAAKDLGVSLVDSFVVGDKRSDMEMAKAIGAKAVLVRTGYGSEVEKAGDPIWDIAVEGILEASDIIAGWVGGVKDDFEDE